MKKYVGIDVGGTEIKFALLDEKAQFLEKGLIDTPHTNLEDFVEAIAAQSLPLYILHPYSH